MPVSAWSFRRHSSEREKQIKEWNRAWKLELVESHNPDWKDLWEGIL